MGLRIAAVYGGADIDRQVAKLRQGVEVIIATPGRLIDLGDRGELSVADLEILVLDEADRMADMGFMPQVEWVLRRLERPHQTLLFSATLDGAVDRLVTALPDRPGPPRGGLEHPDGGRHGAPLPPGAPDGQGQGGGGHLPAPDKSLVFVRTKRGADRLVEQLGKEGIAAAAIHGDLRQSNRERALADFSSGKLPVLVATDVAARGLHIDGVDVVVHYDPPEDHKAYLHRSGRTARAGETGVVATLVLWNQAGRGRGDPAPPGPADPDRRDVLQRPPPGRPGRLDAVGRRGRPLTDRRDRPAAPVPAGPPGTGSSRVLVVTAHPDDVDFGSAGTVATFTDAGVEVAYCIVTDGDAGGQDRTMARAEMAAIRRREQRAAAAVVGVTTCGSSATPTVGVTATFELRRDISRVIRQFRPQRVVTQSPERNWDRIYASHPDHLAAGEAAAAAVYPDARNPFAHPELLEDEGLEPHTVDELWLMAFDHPTMAVETTAAFDRKVAALRSHESQVAEREGLDAMLREWGSGVARAVGLPDGSVAEAYRVVQTR